ncbi:MAG: hypothetical protein K6L74_16035 [Neptuniibacter sp.]
MSYPNISKDEYIEALKYVRDKHHISGDHSYIQLIRAHGAAENSRITMTQLADELGYENFNAANLHYGKYAHLIANALNFQPQTGKDGNPIWWMTLASGEPGVDLSSNGHFEIQMHPELLNALKHMRWVRS